MTEENDPAQINDEAEWITFYSKELVRMTQTKVNDVKKSNRMSMKVMRVKTKELNEKATKRKK